MFGGPLVGVAAFVIIAIALGWGLITLFNAMLDQTRRDVTGTELNHGFVAQGVYLTQKPLLLGYAADGRLLLFPERDDLPRDAPGRRTAATLAGYRAYQAAVEAGGSGEARYRDLRGVVEPGTAIRIDRVIEDTDNAQTRLLLRCTVLTGPFEGEQPIGLHLEARSADDKTAAPRYDPRPELLVPARPADAADPLQSDDPQVPGTDPAPPPDAP